VTHEVIQDSKGVRSHPAVSVLTALLHDDSTRPSAANVKVSQVLQNGGDNFQVWMYELIHAAISKECVEAFQKPLPCTRANAAAIMLLTSSTPVEWGPIITTKPSAYAALVWISDKFQGGKDKTINKQWERQLKTEGMRRDENLEQYVTRKQVNFNNLVSNNHSIEYDDLVTAIVDGLPPEMQEGRTGLYTACYGREPEEILKVLRIHAHGIKFNDQVPRITAKAAPAILPKRPENGKFDGAKKGPGKIRCWNCGDFGHLRRDCTKWEDKENLAEPSKGSKPQIFTRNTVVPEPCAPCPSINGNFAVISPVVTYNVFHSGSLQETSEEWLVDSGATVHLVNDFSLLHNPTMYSEPRKLQLATAEGMGTIIGSGSVCLLNGEGKSVWLHNVQCVPQAGSNLLSVSAGIRDGLSFTTNDFGAFLGMNGQGDWECRIVEQYGLYLLKGVYPTSLPFVCQHCVPYSCANHATVQMKHDCKLRARWHERLGHPGKQCQKD
jgi:hypothetical protein